MIIDGFPYPFDLYDEKCSNGKFIYNTNENDQEALKMIK